MIVSRILWRPLDWVTNCHETKIVWECFDEQSLASCEPIQWHWHRWCRWCSSPSNLLCLLCVFVHVSLLISFEFQISFNIVDLLNGQQHPSFLMWRLFDGFFFGLLSLGSCYGIQMYTFPLPTPISFPIFCLPMTVVTNVCNFIHMYIFVLRNKYQHSQKRKRVHAIW